MAPNGSIISSIKAIPGAQKPTSANQGLPGISTAQISPLAADLTSGGAGTWSSAYRTYLPRPAADFTDGAFGPFSPILPVPVDAPPADSDLPEPRLFEYEVGWNLPTGRPGSEGIKLADFQSLRTLADLYSVARAAIQLRKSEIRSLTWDIMPTKEASKAMRGDHTAMRDFGERRAAAVKFFKKPDPDYFSWDTFIDALMEEVLVYDAMSLLHRMKWAKGQRRGLLGSDLDSLSLLSGPTIRPLLGMHGERPRPPAPAYQQYLYGVPRSDIMTMVTDRDIEQGGLTGTELSSFRTDQLLYLPMVPRRWTPYGFPPIERALIPTMSGLQKQGYQLDFFKEGTVPAVFVSPGDGNANMTPNNLRELQDALNAIAGDPAWKHKIIVLPAGSRVDPQRSPQIADAFDEIVMTQVCMAFDVMPMELGIQPKVSTTVSPGAGNQMAKMTANASDRKATKPTLRYLSDIFDNVLQNVCGQEDMRFVFEGQIEEEDEATTTDLIVRQVSTGLRSIDEGRERLNLQPWGLPETSDPGWSTPATGFVTLAEAAAQRQVSLEASKKLAENAGQPPQAKPGEGPGEGSGGSGAQSPGHEAAEGDQNSRKTPPSGSGDAQKAARPVPPGVARHQARRANRVDQAASYASKTLRTVIDRYQEGEIDATTAVNDGVAELARGYRLVMRAAVADARRDHGLGGTRKSEDDDELDGDYEFADSEAATRAEGQRGFLAGLISDLANGGIQALGRLASRLDLYGRTMYGAYNAAYGRTLQSDGEYQVVWHLGASEHCGACIARDGKVYTFHSLPGWPGDGGFGDVCMGGPNCKCSLDYIKEGDPVETGGNPLRDDDTEVGYYQDQLRDITARRQRADTAREAFLAGVPEPSRSEAQSRDDIRRRLSGLANARIRATGGYGGISVEPGDITANEVVHNELMREPVYRMVYAEMESAARHLSKGLPIEAWRQRNVTAEDLQRMSFLIGPGFVTYKEAARRMMRRVIDTQGQERWIDDDAGPQGGPAGGGGPTLHASDANGIPKSTEPVVVKGDQGVTNSPAFRGAYQSMIGDFPVHALVWMAFVKWTGPVAVTADDLDFDDADAWAAHHEHAKVAKFARKLLAGEEVRPILLVRKPGHDKAMIVDGHHRALASKLTGKPVLAYIANVPKEDGAWDETHSYQRTEGDGGSEYSYQGKSDGSSVIAAGVCIQADDTRRVLMLQRSYDDSDPAAGYWEFPGGCLEDGEQPEEAAIREWQEETGLTFPANAQRVGSWASDNGVYAGFVYRVPRETDLPIFDGRYEVTNPDDPDGDHAESLAWWDLEHTFDNSAIRPELRGDWNSAGRGILGD